VLTAKHMKERSTQALSQSYLCSLEDSNRKLSYLKGVYNSDATQFYAPMQQGPGLRSSLTPVLYRTNPTQEDVDHFQEGVKHRLYSGMDALRNHTDESTVTRGQAEKVRWSVVDPAERGQRTTEDFNRDCEQGSLVKQKIDLAERLYRKEEVERAIREDPQAKVLIDANVRYHSEKLSELLGGIGRDLRGTKLPAHLIEKRAVENDLLVGTVGCCWVLMERELARAVSCRQTP
jgi:hypothetical protein